MTDVDSGVSLYINIFPLIDMQTMYIESRIRRILQLITQGNMGL